METLAYLVALLARHSYLTMLLAVLFFLAYIVRLSRTPAPSAPDGTQTRSLNLIPWIAVGACVALNFVVGNWMADTLIYKMGLPGRATIVGQQHTGASDNQDQPIERFDVLISTQDDHSVESSFVADDSVVYPYKFSPELPQQTELFNVRYLPHSPRTFVIIGNDDSPWATGVRCRPFAQAASAAGTKHTFAPADAGYRRRYHDAVAALLNANCPLDAGEVTYYHQQLDGSADGR